MNKQEKAAWLADLYQHVAAGGGLEFNFSKDGWRIPQWQQPNFSSIPDLWRKKPLPRVVDLTCLIESGIDCEFYDRSKDHWFVAKLLKIRSEQLYPTHIDDGRRCWYKCRPRTNHVHAWQGGECPLPEGMRVRVYERDGSCYEAEALTLEWEHHNSLRDIMQYEVLPGLADGYVWPWEEVES